MNARHEPSGRRAARGVAAVEFAFLLTPLLLMIFGTTEFGRAIYTYNTLDKAARDAARHLSQRGAGDSVVQAEARCLAVYGNTVCSGAPLAPGLTTANVTVTQAVESIGSGTINLVSVTVTGYAYSSLVQFAMPDVTFNDISVTMRAQL